MLYVFCNCGPLHVDISFICFPLSYKFSNGVSVSNSALGLLYGHGILTIYDNLIMMICMFIIYNVLE